MTQHFEEQHDEVMSDLRCALETAPRVTVPADFAARVMAQLPQTQPAATMRRARALPLRYGKAATFAALGVLVSAMLLLTWLTGARGMWSLLQIGLLAQLMGYLLWIGLASWRRQ